jgi:SAM-dependent methyltransferase
VADDVRWNHNIHHHPIVLEALPMPCDRVLDVGCGEGMLALELADRAGEVIGLDLDEPTIEVARRDAPAGNIRYEVGDLLTADLQPGSFDAVVSVAVVHHLDLASALGRMRDLVRPGGVVAVIGLARSRSPIDLSHDARGFVATRVKARSNGGAHWETAAPKVWPPPHTYTEARRIAERVLPGVRYRRHVLFRYSLVWTKPADEA